MIIGVSGAGFCSRDMAKIAYETGREIATRGHILVNGGLGGVMESSARGAKEAGGLTIGILPGDFPDEANPYITIPIITNMGHARNMILVHTADVLIALEGKLGTLSEIAIALKIGKSVISLASWDIPGVFRAKTPKDALDMACIKKTIV